MQETNSILISPNDNVAVAIYALNKGDTAVFKKQTGEDQKILISNTIPVYHKFSIKNIKKGEPIIKYGEHIGIASSDIRIGEHVHINNVTSCRENLKS